MNGAHVGIFEEVDETHAFYFDIFIFGGRL